MYRGFSAFHARGIYFCLVALPRAANGVSLHALPPWGSFTGRGLQALEALLYPKERCPRLWLLNLPSKQDCSLARNQSTDPGMGSHKSTKLSRLSV